MVRNQLFFILKVLRKILSKDAMGLMREVRQMVQMKAVRGRKAGVLGFCFCGGFYLEL
jgi:dienelactone hydrolase